MNHVLGDKEVERDTLNTLCLVNLPCWCRDWTCKQNRGHWADLSAHWGLCGFSYLTAFRFLCAGFHGSLIKSLYSFPVCFCLPKPGFPCSFSTGSSWLYRYAFLLKLKLISDSFDMALASSRVCSIKVETSQAHPFLRLYVCSIYGLSIAEDNSQTWLFLRTLLLAQC